ncbi:MAG: nucleotidyltransferase, partial [Candidatus Competibacteraceae bacterium]|nr:nucleotidyltransferase [Candidatus Competibacteraceae bacterium]
MIKKPRSETKLRYLIAHETAKIMAEEGIKDYRLAKSKAANRLGQSLQTCLPSNSEVEAALL